MLYTISVVFFYVISIIFVFFCYVIYLICIFFFYVTWFISIFLLRQPHNFCHRHLLPLRLRHPCLFLFLYLHRPCLHILWRRSHHLHLILLRCLHYCLLLSGQSHHLSLLLLYYYNIMSPSFVLSFASFISSFISFLPYLPSSVCQFHHLCLFWLWLIIAQWNVFLESIYAKLHSNNKYTGMSTFR